ncbi:hypothetical protein HK096_005579 [Nowakowskiella sp. JEL0078]|nr:hypothetical protein HK096_005579 [Nowakowskiella sp. JEL0078]
MDFPDEFFLPESKDDKLYEVEISSDFGNTEEQNINSLKYKSKNTSEKDALLDSGTSNCLIELDCIGKDELNTFENTNEIFFDTTNSKKFGIKREYTFKPNIEEIKKAKIQKSSKFIDEALDNCRLFSEDKLSFEESLTPGVIVDDDEVIEFFDIEAKKQFQNKERTIHKKNFSNPGKLVIKSDEISLDGTMSTTHSRIYD